MDHVMEHIMEIYLKNRAGNTKRKWWHGFVKKQTYLSTDI
jgi:hypothetical protein